MARRRAPVVAPVGQAFGKDAFAAELYASDLYHADGRGVELAAMVLFNTIYGEFIEEKTTYAEVLAVGATARPRALKAMRHVERQIGDPIHLGELFGADDIFRAEFATAPFNQRVQ